MSTTLKYYTSAIYVVQMVTAFLLLHFTGAGQKTDFITRQISVQDGLVSNKIEGILQDSRGFIWFDTDAGLQRYDGSIQDSAGPRLRLTTAPTIILSFTTMILKPPIHSPTTH